MMICALPLGRQLVIQDISLHPDQRVSGDYANGSHHEQPYSDHVTFEQAFAMLRLLDQHVLRHGALH